MDLTSEDQIPVGSEGHVMDKIHVSESTTDKKHSNKAAVFGISLDDLMGHSPNLNVPFVLSRLCCYIEKHGLNNNQLFKEQGENSMAEHLKLKFNECGDAPLETLGNVASATKLLKQFFEELPEPLIPLSMHQAFITFSDMEKLVDPEDYVKHLKCVVDGLPDTSFHVLKYLLRFLLRIVSHSDINGITSSDLSVVFGPILFRLSSDDQLLYYFIEVTDYFVSDYYAIFEGDAELSSTEDNGRSDTPESGHKSFPSLSASQRKACPYQSSIMPLGPMQPLSVVIPPVDSVLQGSDENAENNRSIPVLLIERQAEKLSEVSVIKQMCIEENGSTRDKNDNPIPTRKRKERRLSGDELQPQRSSSEERPSPLPEESSDRKEFLRRCSSHEEMKELANQAFGFDHNKEFASELSKIGGKALKAIGPYFAEPLEQDVGDRDHSPHPPNPKRREIDSSDYRSPDSQSQRDVCRTWANPKRPAAGAESSLRGKKASFDIPLNKAETVTEDLGQDNMDCSSTSFTSESKFMTKDHEASGDVEDNLTSVRVGIPRSASCPLPNKDDESCPEAREDADNHLSLSWNMLFESEDSEPIRSEHRLSWPLLKGSQDDDALLSPSVHNLRKSSSYEAPLSPSAFRSYLSYRNSHLDPSVPPSPPVEQEDFGGKSLGKEDVVSATIKQITKRIHSLKKKIRRFDEFYETEYGYKPSHAEKTNHPDAKKLMSDLNKARKELKALKEESHLSVSSSSGAQWSPSKEAHILEDTTNCVRDENCFMKSIKPKPTVEVSLGETMKVLADERKISQRPELVEEMTKEQVQAEKFAIQKALLHFESIHGRPAKKSDRNTMRPLYDRYRSVKRLLVRSSSFSNTTAKNKDNCTELQPILEHETMDFTSPQHRKTSDIPDATEGSEGNSQEVDGASKPVTPAAEEEAEDKLPHKVSAAFQILATKYNNSNLHELPLSEMIFQQQQARSEKRRLRKILREFEEEFQRLNGRKVQKEDKAPVETLYAEYKHVKARLRLLEALVSKHDPHQIT